MCGCVPDGLIDSWVVFPSGLIRLRLHALTNGVLMGGGGGAVEKVRIQAFRNQLRGAVKEEIPRVRAATLMAAEMQQLQ